MFAGIYYHDCMEKYIKLVIEGMDLVLAREQAIEYANRKDDLLEAFNRKVEAIIRKIKQPFIFIGQRTTKFFSQLRNLWILFNQRCPEVKKPKLIE